MSSPPTAQAHALESDADRFLSLAQQAAYHPDVGPKHHLHLWTPHRHQVNPCSAAARSDACKISLPPRAPSAAAAPFPPLLQKNLQLQACWGLFAAASTREGDWLGSGSPGERDRDGQSVSQYVPHAFPHCIFATI